MVLGEFDILSWEGELVNSVRKDAGIGVVVLGKWGGVGVEGVFKIVYGDAIWLFRG